VRTTATKTDIDALSVDTIGGLATGEAQQADSGHPEPPMDPPKGDQ
jgi:hypothetical protein